MSSLDYHESADGIHIITLNTTREFDPEVITDLLGEIHHFAYGKPAYIMLNLEAHYRLPLREFVTELKHFYKRVDGSNLRIALVAQPSVVNVLQTMVKTLVTRESIQYFTVTDSAAQWLLLEIKKNAA